MPHFTLTVVTSADGFIADATGAPPQTWASPEEQALFRADVAAADWAIMGRRTHEAAPRSDRRRIVFSTSGGSGRWPRPQQFWVDPSDLRPGDLVEAVRPVRALQRGLILGGTRVHDWFRSHRAIDRVHLTIEPVSFGAGLPVFADQTETDPLAVFTAAGYFPVSDRPLNAGGTRYLILEPG